MNIRTTTAATTALVALTLAAAPCFAGPLFSPTGYIYRATIDFDYYQEGEILTNFPVLVKLGTNVTGFSYSQFFVANGGDLRFATDGTNELYYEIDAWNSNGISYAWVQLPMLSSNGVSIRAYWGNAAATKPAYTTNGMAWSGAGFLGVWHMNQPGAVNSVNGSAGTAHSNINTNGIVGTAQFFALPPNNNNYISVGDLRVTNYTISAWCRNTYTLNDKTVFKKVNSFLWEQWNTDYNLNQQVLGPSNQYFSAGANLDLAEPKWTHEMVTYNAAVGVGNAFMNGNQANNYPMTKGLITPNANANQCTIGENSANHSYYGRIDEVRLENVTRSRAWAVACYHNQSSPETFVSIEMDPMLTLAMGVETNLVLSWPGVGTLQASPGLNAATAWTTNGLPAPVGSNGLNWVFLPINGTGAFYRVKLYDKDFGISCSSTNIALAQGSAGAITVAVDRFNGFAKYVALAASNVPAGVFTAFSSVTTTNLSGLAIDVDTSAAASTTTVTIVGTCAGVTRLATVSISVTGAPLGSVYSWPPYIPNLNYNYTNDHLAVAPPTMVLDDASGVVGTITSGWWCFRYGDPRNMLVTSNAWIPMLDYFNQEFSYFTDVMGWPRDYRAQNGYFSAIYLFGSNIAGMGSDTNALGGWMGSTWYDDQAWPMVLASYYPVYKFDPSQTDDGSQGAMIHEGIHSILASMDGCKQAAWFHEGGNTWLQSTAAAKRSGNYNAMGWLSIGAMIAPFMPVECYSGWLQDDSFGGPSAEGVNMYSNSVQLCTWRNLLGGTQYGESFPHFMETSVSLGSIAWIWQNCTERVLEGLATKPGGLGEYQTRRLIKEFRGRQVMCDFGVWSNAYKGLLDGGWGALIDKESDPAWIDPPVWTARCYVATSNSGGTLTPEWRTLPAWSGGNQIPLTVSGTGTVAITFTPLGTNMSCQLVYRATDNSVVYSRPVSSGTCYLTCTKAVKNNVMVAVVCNTDYVYQGDYSRTNKYDYRITLGANVSGTASISTKWYQ